MKSVFIALLIISSSAIAQEFEGEITYVRKVIPKDLALNVDSLLSSSSGDSALYIISGSNYKCTFFHKGIVTYTYTYHHANYKFYFEYPDTDYLTYSDSRKGSDSLISLIMYPDSITNIAGYACWKGEKQFLSHQSTAYYSKDIKINPEAFKGHKASDWYNELRKSNGCFNIKSVTDHGSYIEIFEAVKVAQKKIPKKVFNLPYGKPVVASAYALDKYVDIKWSPTAIDCYESRASKAPNVFDKTKEIICTIRFIATVEGKAEKIKADEKDEYDLYKIAIDVIENCGMEIIPGEINNKPVSSEWMINIGFKI